MGAKTVEVLLTFTVPASFDFVQTAGLAAAIVSAARIEVGDADIVSLTIDDGE